MRTDSVMLPAFLQGYHEAIQGPRLRIIKMLLPNMGQAKDKHGVRKSLAKVLQHFISSRWSFPHWLFTPLRVGGPPTPQAFLANSNIYTKNQAKTLFFSVFLHFFRQKRRNLHVFRLKVGPRHWFLQCFQCSGIQKPFKISLFTVLFHFCPFFPCRKPTKMTQNSVSIPS